MRPRLFFGIETTHPLVITVDCATKVDGASDSRPKGEPWGFIADVCRTRGGAIRETRQGVVLAEGGG